jgi:cytoplasmic iron level regulating protein YaaA (DUF328/UPF0246 family)
VPTASGPSSLVILLPPSQGKAIGGSGAWKPRQGEFGRTLGAPREALIGALTRAGGGTEAVLGVRGSHLARAKVANRSLVGAATLPAWQRYTGVVWDHLDLAGLPAATRTAVTKRIIVPSGFAGLVRADDPRPDYRLKMGARLAPFGLLSTWWRDDLTDALLAHTKKAPIVDLLPQEHRAAVDWSRVNTLVRIDLVSKSGGIVGGHNAKAAKGLLARHLLLSTGTDFERMVSTFVHPEYSAKVSS